MELRVKPLAPNQSLSASSLFFLCFSTIVEVKFAFSLLYSPLRTSPPPHPLPSTKQRKSEPSDSYTNSSDTKDQEVERKGGRGYLEPNSPMMQPNARTYATFATLGQNVKSVIFSAPFSFRIHRSRYTAWRYYLRCWNPKVYNSRSKFPQCHNLPTWLVAEQHSPLHHRQRHWWVFPERLQPTSRNRCNTKSLW